MYRQHYTKDLSRLNDFSGGGILIMGSGQWLFLMESKTIVDHGGCDLQFRFKEPDGNKFNVWQNSKKS